MGKGREYLGEFEQVVLLAMVRVGEGAYGASIHKEILETTGRDVSIPSVYVTLKRLEKKGQVRSTVAPLEPGARKTRNYEVTAEGREALHRSRELLDSLWTGSGLEAGEGSR